MMMNYIIVPTAKYLVAEVNSILEDQNKEIALNAPEHGKQSLPSVGWHAECQRWQSPFLDGIEIE